MKAFTPGEALRLFLIDKEDARVKPTTLKMYRYHCERFISEADLPPDISQLSTAHLRSWSALLREGGLKPSAIHSYQQSVWTFVRWLYTQEEFGVGDLTRRVKMAQVREEDVKRRTATQSTLKKLLLVAKDRSQHPRRNAAIIECLWSTGARRSELAACQLSDYDAENGTLYLATTKMGRPRRIAIESSARRALDAYIIRERGKAPGSLFLTSSGKPMTSGAIRLMLRSHAECAGVEVSAHDFRRAASARWLKQGAPVDVVMSQLGHTDPGMTLIYGKEGREDRSIKVIHDMDRGLRFLSG